MKQYKRYLAILALSFLFLLLCLLQLKYFPEFQAFMPLVIPGFYHLTQLTYHSKKIRSMGADEPKRKVWGRKRDMGQQLVHVLKYLALLLYISNRILQVYIVLVVFFISALFHFTSYAKLRIKTEKLSLLASFLSEVVGLGFDCSVFTWLLKTNGYFRTPSDKTWACLFWLPSAILISLFLSTSCLGINVLYQGGRKLAGKNVKTDIKH